METTTLPHTDALKEAPTTHPVHPLVRRRWSARAFGEASIGDDELATLLEAAAWAPSAMNEQPWRFRHARRGTPAFDALWDLLKPGNQPWTRNAALLIAISGVKHHARNEAPNASWQHDVGLATANLLLQATGLGIHGHLMGGFDKERTQEHLGLDPEREEVVTILALGRITDPETLEEPFRGRELAPRPANRWKRSPFPFEPNMNRCRPAPQPNNDHGDRNDHHDQMGHRPGPQRSAVQGEAPDDQHRDRQLQAVRRGGRTGS